MGLASESRNPDEEPVVLCGLGRVGWKVFELLRSAGQTLIVVDTNPPEDDPRLAGILVIKGDCRRPENLDRAGVTSARGVLLLTSDDLVNVSTALLVRRMNPDTRIVVRMFNQNLLARFGAAIKNTVALSVSALTAPMLALTAATGEALGEDKGCTPTVAVRVEGDRVLVAASALRARAA